MNKAPEINCDLGEGISHEADIFPWIDAASIACGGHFGDKNTISKSLDLAIQFNTKVGAHPSYPDPENFGRKSIKIAPTELLDSLREQIDLFVEIAQLKGLPMDHIKLHGALYNDAAKNPGLAELLSNFLTLNYPNVPIFTSPNSELEKFSLKKLIPIRKEVFADRAYNPDFSLVSRNVEGALFTDIEQIKNHLTPLLEKGYISAINGSKLPISADTLCFHGDNPGLVHFLPEIRKIWW
ncbi:LamB/YcsF family protein [Algoriphagus machipongonensis]|uniref:Lactam utilization protein n=1 Tax=Algoriphagus machipongonensis TaxID=388413 RepID=A3HS16_9BACT|nr:LamB/YcsF family protein [Algoriphagus machipongonensis]EAZ82634.1 putative lactam utilization protein [Algoriphagus machipongonensis]